jgi:hypothetical protein
MSGKGNPMLRPAAATLALCLLAAGWTGWGQFHSRRVMASLPAVSGRANLAVSLDFEPEAFHITRLQAIGRVIEVRGATVYVMDVNTGDMRDFSTAYWVREVRAWPGR